MQIEEPLPEEVDAAYEEKVDAAYEMGVSRLNILLETLEVAKEWVSYFDFRWLFLHIN